MGQYNQYVEKLCEVKSVVHVKCFQLANSLLKFLQLNIKDAFELCRYEWMREALEAFLRVMAKEQKLDMEEEKDTPTLPLSEVVAECQMIPFFELLCKSFKWPTSQY